MKHIVNGLLRTLPGRLLRVIFSAVDISIRRGHGNPLVVFRQFQKLIGIFVQHRFWPRDALRWGLLDQDGDLSKRYVSKNRLVAYQNYLNHSSFHPLVEEKSLFYSYCQRVGLPVPELYGVFFKRAAGWSRVSGRSLINKDDFVCFLNEDCPTYFVIKPSNGVYGKGIRFVDKHTGFSPEDLYDALMADEYGAFVIQEALTNHPEIQQLNNKRGLQTLRIATFVNSRGDLKIVQGSFKAIVGDNLIDNHNSGATGNLLCQVDVESGRLSAPMVLTDNGPVRMKAHPETGQVLEGVKLPQWEEAVSLVKKAALEFLPMRSIGWDVALSERGPVLIEGNARWDPPKHGAFGTDNEFFSELPGPFRGSNKLDGTTEVSKA